MIIGLSLGIVTDYSTLAVLIGVLAVHQFLEGLSIGYILSGLASKVQAKAARQKLHSRISREL